MNNLIVDKALEYVGTPYAHHGRVKFVGVDCAGLLVCVGRELGIFAPDFDQIGYSQQPDGVKLLQVTRELFPFEVKQSELKAGNIVVIKSAMQQRPHHFGIVGTHPSGNLSIIHASCDKLHNAVVEQRLVFCRSLQFVAGFEFRVK